MHYLSPQELQTIASYEEIAEERAKRIPPGNRWWATKLVEFTRLLYGGQILDIGCGDGRDARLFQCWLPYQYIGIDISPAMLKLARASTPHALLSRQNMYELGFQSGCFEGFWAAASLLHIPKSQIAKPLAEIKRVVKQGGIGFIAIREGDTEEMVIRMRDICGDSRFYAFYHQDEFCQLLQENGFEVLKKYRDLREYIKNPVPRNVWLTFFVRNS